MIHQTSPRTDRRQQRRHARSEQMLDVAMSLVATHGLDGLTLQRLASELGYVPAALYRYFDSKDALLAALQQRTIEQLHQSFCSEQARQSGRVAALGLPPAQQALFALLAAADFYLALPSRMPERFRLVSLMLGDPRTLIARDKAAGNAQALLGFLGDVRELFRRAATARALARGGSFDRTLAYWSALHGVATLDKLTRFDVATFEVRRLGELTARTLLLGWGAQAATLERAEHALTRLGAPSVD